MGNTSEQANQNMEMFIFNSWPKKMQVKKVISKTEEK